MEFILIFIGANYNLGLKSGTYPMKFREEKFLLPSQKLITYKVEFTPKSQKKN